jgi:ribosomal protein S6--L-glutamate ligase
MDRERIIVGREEWCSLHDLGVPAIKVRIDSGAKTSALHAFNIHVFSANGEDWVEFDIHPIQHNRRVMKHCRARLVDQRVIKSSNGENEKRYVISTPITLGNSTWEIEVTLTNRDSMGYRMLLGREAMQGRILVDPEAVFCHSNMDDLQAIGLYHNNRQCSGLRIVLLASNPDLYSNRRIMEAGKSRGHEMIFINVAQAYININSKCQLVNYRGKDTLGHIDAVIPRLRPTMTYYGCAVTRQFQSRGAFCLNDANAIHRSRDKLLSLQMLAGKGINLPITSFAHSPEDTKELIKLVGGAPVIIKLLEGTQGVGVVLAETTKAAESVINAFKSIHANILVQEFIKEANGIDIRCFVIDGKVVGAMQRKAAQGEFRANIHRGGIASPIKLTGAERKMAISAASVMRLHVAGVDIIRSSDGPKVLEVNSSPGLEGIESVTHKDIASMLIESIEKHVCGKHG